MLVMKPFRENNFVARCFIWVAVCIRVSTTSTSWNKFSVTNGSCLFRSACFYFNLLIYFVISRLIYSFSCFCYQFSLRGWKNIKIKIRCFKVLLWTKKEHHYTIKVFIVWKNPSTLNGNLIMHYTEKSSLIFGKMPWFWPSVGSISHLKCIFQVFIGGKTWHFYLLGPFFLCSRWMFLKVP